MAPVRVRGCVVRDSSDRGPVRQADASRRRNGPRKDDRTVSVRRLITERLRSKSCPAGRSDSFLSGRGPVVATSCKGLSRRVWGRRPGRPDGCRLPAKRSDSRRHVWMSWSRVVTTRFRTGSGPTSRRSCPSSRSTTSASSASTSRSRKEPNPRLADQSVRVEITIRSRGPVIRAEAAAEDTMTALDKAMGRLNAQARKAADRRRIHRGSHTPTSLAQAMAATPVDGVEPVERGRGARAQGGLAHGDRRRTARSSARRSIRPPR